MIPENTEVIISQFLGRFTQDLVRDMMYNQFIREIGVLQRKFDNSAEPVRILDGRFCGIIKNCTKLLYL